MCGATGRAFGMNDFARLNRPHGLPLFPVEFPITENVEIKMMLEQQGAAIEAFRGQHELALAEECKEREDLELRLSRSGFAADGPIEAKAVRAERKAVGAFIRTGDETELKSMSVGSDPDGGYTVVRQMAEAIRTKVRGLSPIANLARRVIIEASDGYAEPYDLDDMAAEWVGETGSRPSLTTPNFALLSVPLEEIYTSQVVTQKLLDTNSYTRISHMGSDYTAF